MSAEHHVGSPETAGHFDCEARIVALAIAACAFVGLFAAANPAANQRQPAQPVAAAAADWPLFRGDAQSTGVARSPLPDKLQLLWRRSFKAGGFTSAVAIVEGVVYAAGLDGNVYALDLATGHDRWTFKTEDSFSAAPAVRNGLVYVGDQAGRFYCLDAATGTVKWGHEAAATIDSSANFYQDKVLFGSQDSTLYCLTAADGQLVWKRQIGDQIRTCPTIVEGLAFVAGCDGQLHMFDIEKGEPAKSVDIQGPTACTPAVVGDFAYVGTEGESFFAVNWRKAEVAWTYRNPGRGMAFRSSAAAAQDIVVVGGRDKLVHALNPANGEEVWSFPTRAMVDASPVLVGNQVFIGSYDGRIYALDRKSGEKLWEYEAGGRITASPAVAAGKLIIGTEDGDLLCFGARN